MVLCCCVDRLEATNNWYEVLVTLACEEHQIVSTSVGYCWILVPLAWGLSWWNFILELICGFRGCVSATADIPEDGIRSQIRENAEIPRRMWNAVPKCFSTQKLWVGWQKLFWSWWRCCLTAQQKLLVAHSISFTTAIACCDCRCWSANQPAGPQNSQFWQMVDQSPWQQRSIITRKPVPKRPFPTT